ncbi:MAG TPA: zinc-ribbon domain containing protein [Acidobacteriaceae bacterium]|nr:zinc-ribbon domain containing protein [Acidobacteriaceae bacterium]
MEFTDRILKCSDCGNEFVFTAGEQLFFYDKQFKNDPKRCKLCKAKRAGLGRSANATGAVTLPLSRTETRTKCSACGVETTVPFKPTQGRPVLCRSCFQLKRVPSGVAAVAQMDSAATQVANAMEQVLPSADGVETSASAMELITQAPAAVIAENSDAPLAAVAAEAAQA